MNSIYQKTSISLIIIIILSGCLNTKTRLPQIIDISPSQIIIPSQLDKLMEFYGFLNKKTVAELAEEHDNAKQNFIHEDNIKNRVRYALLLALPGTTFHSNNAALKLLKEWPQSERQPSGLNSFRNLLLHLLIEQKRRSNVASNLSEELQKAQERATVLQKKVDDIKDMEKNLIRRNTY